ncbi:MAG: transglutaminase family protein [Pseudobdellovibrionaceae bacterium]
MDTFERETLAPESPYLQSSATCNFTTAYFKDFLNQIVSHRDTQAEKAVKIFSWVRDNISYELGLRPDTAAGTLVRRAGSCTNKANLMVALARAAQIPAAFHIMRVKTKDYFGPVCTPRFSAFMSNESLHIYTAFNVEGRWLKADGTDDKTLCLSSSHLCRQSELVVFDGQSDAMINLDQNHIVFDDPIRYPHIDNILGKKMRLPSSIINVMNLYLTFIRLHGKAYNHVTDLEGGFFSWLSSTFPVENEDFNLAEQEILKKINFRMPKQELRSQNEKVGN